MADITGGPGAGNTYTVHYRRKDGTEASGIAESNDHGGFSWIAPEDCAAITGISEVGGGGRSPQPNGWGGGEPATVTVTPGVTVDPFADGSHELVIRLGRPFDVWVAGGYLNNVTEFTVPFDGEQYAESAAAEIKVTVRRGTRPDPEGYLADLRRRLADKDAEIARLTAELDDLRQVPVELVTERGLEAAMAADPDRADGTVLRVTDGKREAWVWRAATTEWEKVQ